MAGRLSPQGPAQEAPGHQIPTTRKQRPRGCPKAFEADRDASARGDRLAILHRWLHQELWRQRDGGLAKANARWLFRHDDAIKQRTLRTYLATDGGLAIEALFQRLGGKDGHELGRRRSP